MITGIFKLRIIVASSQRPILNCLFLSLLDQILIDHKKRIILLYKITKQKFTVLKFYIYAFGCLTNGQIFKEQMLNDQMNIHKKEPNFYLLILLSSNPFFYIVTTLKHGCIKLYVGREPKCSRGNSPYVNIALLKAAYT